jgi:hypothetical protein
MLNVRVQQSESRWRTTVAGLRLAGRHVLLQGMSRSSKCERLAHAAQVPSNRMVLRMWEVTHSRDCDPA